MFSLEEYFRTREKVFNVLSETFGVDRCALGLLGDRSERVPRRILYVIGDKFLEEENSEIRDRFYNAIGEGDKVDFIDNRPLKGSEEPLQLLSIGKINDISLYIIYESADIMKLEDKDRRKAKKEAVILYESFMKGFEDAHLKIMTSIVKNVDTGFLVFGEDERILLFNDRMAKILGLATENLMGRNIYDVMGKIYKKWEREQVEESIRTEKTEVLERLERVRQSGKSEYHKIGLSHVETIWGKIYILVDNDLTQWVEIEKLSKYKSDFIASVAHDLKTPLTTIIGYMDILKMGLGDSITTQHKRCIEQSIRLARMIDQTLELSLIDMSLTDDKRKILDKTWLSIQIFLSVLIDAFSQRAEDKEIKLMTVVETGLNTIYTDEKKLLEILRNLLDNAIKFTLPGGKVNIRVYRKRGNIVFEIKDTGIGIPGDDLNRVFERFYRVEREDSDSYGGIGLGLYIVKEFAKLLEGSVEVDSKPGIGSTFRLSIPQPEVK
jgi:two-component system phosphate regulon sensor histidine kinase PhoR